jgi:hypothetical protein
VNSSSLQFNFFYPQNFFIKQVIYLNPLQNQLLLAQLLFKFKIPLLKSKPKTKFSAFLVSIHMSHLTQLEMISITLKCEKKTYLL